MNIDKELVTKLSEKYTNVNELRKGIVALTEKSGKLTEEDKHFLLIVEDFLSEVQVAVSSSIQNIKEETLNKIKKGAPKDFIQKVFTTPKELQDSFIKKE